MFTFGVTILFSLGSYGTLSNNPSALPGRGVGRFDDRMMADGWAPSGFGCSMDVKQPWDTGLGARTGRAELSDESREATQPCGWDGDYRPVRQVAKSRNGVLVDRMTVPQ